MDHCCTSGRNGNITNVSYNIFVESSAYSILGKRNGPLARLTWNSETRKRNGSRIPVLDTGPATVYNRICSNFETRIGWIGVLSQIGNALKTFEMFQIWNALEILELQVSQHSVAKRIIINSPSGWFQIEFRSKILTKDDDDDV
ncbi:unnamed protein product [Rhizophagus irregularis]|nr:unnamed protein product [Rhizophagus irregularis]